MKSVPKKIKTFAILDIVFGSLLVIFNIVFMITSVSNLPSVKRDMLSSSGLFIYGAVHFFILMFFVMSGVGMLKLRSWGKKLGFIVSWVGMILSSVFFFKIVKMLLSSSSIVPSGRMGYVIAFLVVLFLIFVYSFLHFLLMNKYRDIFN